MNKSIVFWVRLILGLLILFGLIYMIGIEELISTFKKLNSVYLFHVFICLFALFLIGSFNIWLLLKIFHSISFLLFLKTYSYSWIASLLTPGQIGDASLVILLKKKYKIPVRNTSTVYVFDKLITLSFFLIIAFYGSVLIIPDLGYLSRPLLWVLLIMTIIILGLLSFLRRERGDKFKNIRKIISEWKILLLNFLITIFKWFMVSATFNFSFLAFGKNVPWPEIGIVPIISTLVGYIPISVAGIGTVEITAGYLFLKIGIETSVVLSAYLMLRILQYFLALFLLGTISCMEKD